MDNSKLYYEEINKLIPLKDKKIKEFLDEIDMLIKECKQSHDNLTYYILVDEIGTPEEIITSYFGENPDSLISNLKRKQYIKRTIISVLSIICAISLLVGGWEMYSLNEEYQQVLEHQPTHCETYIIENND